MENLEQSWDQPVERPGCVTAYAILLWLGGGLYILGGLFALLSTTEDPFGGVVLLICLSVLAAIPIITGLGIWKMSAWGWWIVVILNGLGFAFGLLYLFVGVIAALETPEAFSFLCGALFGLAINGGILYWFIKNRVLFLGEPGYEKVMGPDGEMITKPASQTNAAVIVVVAGVVAIFCLIPVVTIAILTLLGPQIGNVFSRITENLATTPIP